MTTSMRLLQMKEGGHGTKNKVEGEGGEKRKLHTTNYGGDGLEGILTTGMCLSQACSIC